MTFAVELTVRVAILAACLAVTATRGGCGDAAPAWAPCLAKACGEACTLCAPDDPGCAETAEVKACDGTGRCLSWRADLCPAPHPDCVGKLCGDECNPCGPREFCPTFVRSACDDRGQCSGDVPGLCERQCAGEPCGTPCHPPGCPFGAPCLEPGSCDTGGRCVAAGAGPTCPAS